MFPDVLKGFLFLAFIFIPLERSLGLHQQRIARRGWTTDAIYFVLGNFIGRAAGTAIPALLALSFLERLIAPAWQARISSQPIFWQFIEAILLADIGYYLVHRLLHHVPLLWRFHAVHHSIEQMDWLATVRVHPIEQVLTKFFQIVPIFCCGFSSEALAIYALFSSAIAFFIHSNLRLRFGILTWIVATPQFHHWHHADEPNAYNKNFAVQCPLIDLLFGTFYLPRHRVPKQYGIQEAIPMGYFSQLVYPFRFNGKSTMQIMQSSQFRSLRPFFLALGISILGVSSLAVGAIANHMDIPTFVASWTVPKVTAAELKQGKLKEIILIDVRSPEEYAEDRIAGSVLVPLSEIEAGFGAKKIKEIAKASGKSEPTIVLYCAAGVRSVKAYKHMNKTGLNAVSLTGGINTWREIVNKDQDAAVLQQVSD